MYVCIHIYLCPNLPAKTSSYVFGEPSVAGLLCAKWERKCIKSDQKMQPFWEENYDLEVLSLQENWTGQGNNQKPGRKNYLFLLFLLHGRIPVSVWTGQRMCMFEKGIKKASKYFGMRSSKQELKNDFAGHFTMDQDVVTLEHMVSLQIFQPHQAQSPFSFRSSQQFCVLIIWFLVPQWM